MRVFIYRQYSKIAFITTRGDRWKWLGKPCGLDNFQTTEIRSDFGHTRTRNVYACSFKRVILAVHSFFLDNGMWKKMFALSIQRRRTQYKPHAVSEREKLEDFESRKERLSRPAKYGKRNARQKSNMRVLRTHVFAQNCSGKKSLHVYTIHT